MHEYGEFNSYILYSCHPLNDSFYRLHNLLGTLVLFVYVALPLRDREVASLHDKLPCEYFCINFYLMVYAWICCPYFSLVSIITVGTRFLGVKALTNITNGVFSFMLYFLPAKGQSIVVNNVSDSHYLRLTLHSSLSILLRFSRPCSFIKVCAILSV